MHSQHINRNFYLSLLEFLLAGKQHIVSIGADFELTAIQAITLMLLDDSRPRPMKNFCLLYHCDASNVTGIVDGLEKKGLVSRQNDENDRRIKVIKLEPAGKKIQQTMTDRLSKESGYLFDPLNGTETQQFIRIIEKIAAARVSMSCDRQ